MSATTANVPPVIVYRPARRRLPRLGPYLRGVWERRTLVWHLARSDMKAAHYDTVLGQVWIVLNPLLLAAVYYLLRSVVRPIGSDESRSYLIAHLVGAIFFFYLIRNCFSNGANSLLGNRGLLLNSSLPRLVFPLVGLIRALLDFAPTLIVYLLLHAVLGQPFGMALVYLPLIVFLLTVFGFGCGLLVAPLAVFFRDTNSFLPYLLRIWLYTTPILYLSSEIPPNMVPWLRWNPLYPLYAALESMWLAETPSAWYLLAGAGWAVLALVVGAYYFLTREGRVVARL